MKQFQIGDRVRSTYSGSSEGKEGTIIEASQNLGGERTWLIKFDDGETYGSYNYFHPKYLNLIEEKEEPKFKVGDRVRSTLHGDSGRIGKIIAPVIDPTKYTWNVWTIEFEDGKIDGNDNKYAEVFLEKLNLMERANDFARKYSIGCSCSFINCQHTIQVKDQRKGGKMAKLSTIQKANLDADTQALIEADLLYDNLSLTSAGSSVIESIIFGVYREELVKEAKRIIKERKKAC